MKKEVSTTTAVVAILIVILVVAFVGWLAIRDKGTVIMPEDQKAAKQAAFDRGEIGPNAGNTTAPTENAKADGR